MKRLQITHTNTSPFVKLYCKRCQKIKQNLNHQFLGNVIVIEIMKKQTQFYAQKCLSVGYKCMSSKEALSIK